MIKTSTIRVGGLHCADCIRKVENRIRKTKGIHELRLSLATGQLNVTYDTKHVTLPELEKKVEKLGYSVFKSEMAEDKVLSLENKKLIFIIISGITFFSGLVITFLLPDYLFVVLSYDIYLSQVLFVIAMIFGGYYILKEAVSELMEREFAMESLMIVAAIGAVLIDALPEAAAILFLFSIAELLESYATERTRRSINELLNLTPKKVIIKKGAKKVKIPVDLVKPGDIAVIKSGQYIGVDGEVVHGCSSVNQSSITGEPLPVRKAPGDTVYAGTLNQDGTLEVKVTKAVQDSTLAKIIKLVETAEEKKSKHERFMDRFAKYYTPSILLLAILVVVIPTFVFSEPFEVWFYKALMLILISCPCALAISTPVSIVSAITHAAKNGVLFKGGMYVERAAEIETVAFDKTGTLTTGKPKVTDIIPLKGHSKKEILQIASSLECLSKHPLGDAIVACAEAEGTHTEFIEEFKTVNGKGVYGTLNGVTYFVGRKSLFNKKALRGLEKYFKRFSHDAKSVVVIGTKNEALGLIAFADNPREDGKVMVQGLRNAGVKRLVMLTGDNKRTASKLANKLELDEFHAELLPSEKVAIINDITQNKESGKIAMVGDGINDAPALATADLGIAMGAAGSDTALETANVALMNDDLSKVPYIIRLGRKTMSVVKQNIILAISIKLLFAILVFPGFVTLWMAVAIGDMGVSLLVILNALRLGRL